MQQRDSQRTPSEEKRDASVSQLLAHTEAEAGRKRRTDKCGVDRKEQHNDLLEEEDERPQQRSLHLDSERRREHWVEVVHRAVDHARLLGELRGALAQENRRVGLGGHAAEDPHDEGLLERRSGAGPLRRMRKLTKIIRIQNNQRQLTFSPTKPPTMGPRTAEKARVRRELYDEEREKRTWTSERRQRKERHRKGSILRAEQVGNDAATVGERARAEEAGEEAADKERFDVLGECAGKCEEGEEKIGADEDGSTSPLLGEWRPEKRTCGNAVSEPAHCLAQDSHKKACTYRVRNREHRSTIRG